MASNVGGIPELVQASSIRMAGQPGTSEKVPSMFAKQAKENFPHAEEFIFGWGAAFVNIVVTFPLNKVMFRQMIEGVKTTKAIQELQREGFHYLYRGILPPLLQKTTSTALMFGIYERTFRELSPFLPYLPCVVAAGGLAGTCEATLLPFERVQTLLQDKHYHGRFQNTWHCVKELRPHGIREFYRGCTPVLMRNGPGNIVFFGIKDQLKIYYPTRALDVWYKQMIFDFASGAVLGALIGTVFYPFNVIRARMQTRFGGPFQSMREVLVEIYIERGRSWRKVYYGVHMNYTRALVSWGIINACYELFKKAFGTKASKSC